MAVIRVTSILASSRPIEAYGGMQLAENVVAELAESFGAGHLLTNFGHDLARPFNVSNVRSGTDRDENGYLQAWAEYDVEEGPWNEYQKELRAQGIDGLGGMSITFTTALKGQRLVESPLTVAGDAHHFTDEEIQAAANILRSLEPSASGERLYQLSAIPELRVIFDLSFEIGMAVGSGILSTAIYDAARKLFRPEVRNSVDIRFKESKGGTRSLKVAIKFETEGELKVALDRLPAVLESGAAGTFSHQDAGYVQVDSKGLSTVEMPEGTLAVEGSEETLDDDDEKES